MWITGCQYITNTNMDLKKKTLRRLTVLYVVFFVVIGVSVALTFNSNGGFTVGRTDAHKMFEQGLREGMTGNIIYDVRVSTVQTDFNEPLSGEMGDPWVSARPSAVDVKIISEKGDHLPGTTAALWFAFLSALVYASIFVVIFMILRSLRRSVRTDNVFGRHNIVWTRLIGVLLIVGSLLLSLSSWLDSRAVAPFFEGSGYEINTSFPFDFGQLIMGVMVFVVAEIFVIGYTLSEERKLTI